MNGMMHHVSGGNILPDPNTFIGGVGASYITSAADFVSKVSTTLYESDIENFQIDVNNNISFYINVNYSFNSAVFDGGTSGLTYYIDKDGHLTFPSNSLFRYNSGSRIAYHLPGLTYMYLSCFRYYSPSTAIFSGITSTGGTFALASSSRIKWVILNNMTTIGTYLFNGDSAIERIRIPSVTGWTNTNDSSNPFQNIKTGCNIYVDNSQLTVNGGGLPLELDYAQTTRSANIIGITNYTPPNAVTNLSASSITSSGCNLDFTAPSSTNTLDFYEVWVENIDLDEWHSDRVKGRYNINQEITASGDTITGLSSGTNYKIWIVACDEFWNRSEISNVIEITTL